MPNRTCPTPASQPKTLTSARTQARGGSANTIVRNASMSLGTRHSRSFVLSARPSLVCTPNDQAAFAHPRRALSACSHAIGLATLSPGCGATRSVVDTAPCHASGRRPSSPVQPQWVLLGSPRLLQRVSSSSLLVHRNMLLPSSPCWANLLLVTAVCGVACRLIGSQHCRSTGAGKSTATTRT